MSDQLNLGHGDFESVDFDEHSVQVPMPLILDPEVDGGALATYTIMKSFGKRAEASLGAYAERLGWSTDTVRRWQKALVKTGWIVLLREGKDTTPRLWWMAKSKAEPPPLGAFINAPLEKNHPPQKRDPKQGLSKGLQVSSIKEQEQHTPPKTVNTHPEQDQTWLDLKAVWTKKHPSAAPLSWPAKTMRNWQVLLTAELLRLGREELVRRWSNMVNDPWVQASLRAFIQDTDKWHTARTQGASNGRAYQQPTLQDWKPSGKGVPLA